MDTTFVKPHSIQMVFIVLAFHLRCLWEQERERVLNIIGKLRSLCQCHKQWCWCCCWTLWLQLCWNENRIFDHINIWLFNELNSRQSTSIFRILPLSPSQKQKKNTKKQLNKRLQIEISIPVHSVWIVLPNKQNIMMNLTNELY